MERISETDFYLYRIDLIKVGDRYCLELRFKSFTGAVKGVLHILEGSWGWNRLKEILEGGR